MYIIFDRLPVAMGVNSSVSYDIHNNNYLGTPLSAPGFYDNDIIRFAVKCWVGVLTRMRSFAHVVESLVWKLWGA